MTLPHVSLINVSLSRSFIRQKRSHDKRLVLNDICLDIKSGERVGIIGRNGAGKTTLLRTIAGILSPDSGSCERMGVTRAFLDPGYGLELELNGRENAYSRAVIDQLSGMRHEQFMTWVENFSELGYYFDQPLKSYSSGMLARLAFSMCTFDVPEILLIDEGIGTVDAHFRLKALQRLDNIYQDAAILVAATHDHMLLTQLCTRGIVMHQGKVCLDGTIEEAIEFASQMS
jgi:lipopolysaccharide transport system ATP-binding protein